jgi:hypothetical protein
VRSTLITGAMTEEAAAWVTKAHGLSPDHVARALLGTIALPADPGSVAWPDAVAYAGHGVTMPDTVMATEDTSTPWKDGDVNDYKLHLAHDRTSAFVGLLPYQVQTTGGTRTTVMAGVQLSGAPASGLLRYGPAIRDELGGRIGIGARLGDHAYGNGDQESRLVWGVDLFYRLLVGVRMHDFAIYGGLATGWMRISAGDTLAKGFHLEPSAEVTVRAVGVHNVQLAVSGFVTPVASLARRDRVALMLPLWPKSGAGLGLSYERTDVETKTTADDGTTRMTLGDRPVRSYVILLGGWY